MTSSSDDALRLVVLAGDGIGPEISAATEHVIDVAASTFGLAVEFERRDIGLAALDATGTTFPDGIVDAIGRADGVVLGPVDLSAYPPVADGGRNPSGELRKRLDLFANIRPARTPPGFVPRCGSPVDLVIVRENTEGFYADRAMFEGPGEFMPTADVAMSMRKISRAACRRIAEAAFAVATERPARRVTAVHKANVLRVTDGLFLECVREVASSHPTVDYDERLVDATAALLIRDPAQFDVIVTTNMFGDILSDQASELAGSLGLAASLNYGDDAAVAQAQHGSAPDIAGRDLANPTSLIGSAAMLLTWIGRRRGDAQLRAAGAGIDRALDAVLADPATRTCDLGGEVGTRAFAEFVASALARDAAPCPARGGDT